MVAGNRFRKLFGVFSRTGLGGEGILRTEGRGREANQMLTGAYEAGIRYYDSAPAYAGSERYLGRFWQEHPGWAKEAFQTSKSAERDAQGALADLARSLSTLGRDQLGLWQIHDLRDAVDIRRLEAKGGALQAFYSARTTGTVRAIGVTGHHDPAVLLHAVSSWDVDSVLLPVSPIETALSGFSDLVIPAARERGIGVIGMKVFGGGSYLSPESGLLPEHFLRYALSQDVDMVIAGCSNQNEARLLARVGSDPSPMDDEEQSRLVGLFRPYARLLAFYRGVI